MNAETLKFYEVTELGIWAVHLGGLAVEPGLALRRLMQMVVTGALLSYLGAVLIAEPVVSWL